MALQTSNNDNLQTEDNPPVMMAASTGHTRRLRLVSLVVIIAVLGIDQWIKIWVKTSMFLGEKIELADWAYIAFTENKGMAFGMEFMGTLMLCSFRIIAICWLGWALLKITRLPYVRWGMVVLLAMVLAGAAGNIIDNIFYGLIFRDGVGFDPATLVPFGQGSGSLFEGRVVDMFYFPMIDTVWPDWVPLWGGQRFVFFSPIFNFADASITTGGILLVSCYYKTLNRLLSHSPRQQKNSTEE